MSAACMEAHPVEPELYCNRSHSNHENHSAWSPTAETYVDWPNEHYTEPAKVARERAQREAKATLRDIATRTRETTDEHS